MSLHVLLVGAVALHKMNMQASAEWLQRRPAAYETCYA